MPDGFLRLQMRIINMRAPTARSVTKLLKVKPRFEETECTLLLLYPDCLKLYRSTDTEYLGLYSIHELMFQIYLKYF